MGFHDDKLCSSFLSLTSACAVWVQVGFHDDKLVKRTQVQRRLNEIVNRLNKTQVGSRERLPGSCSWVGCIASLADAPVCAPAQVAQCVSVRPLLNERPTPVGSEI